MEILRMCFLLSALCAVSALPAAADIASHGGGLNGCGCHFNRKTGECHCHQPHSCGCACEPAFCAAKKR
jgi:hypothetical protein